MIFQGANGFNLAQNIFYPVFCFSEWFLWQKSKRSIFAEEWDFRADWGEGWSQERRRIGPGFLLVLISLCSSCFFWLSSPLPGATKTIPWFIWRENWIKNGKEADIWVWQLVLTPTHWESKEVYCFSWYLVFGDILFVAVIFKAIQLHYFERWVWEKPFFCFGTSPCLSLPVTATVLCQSFSEAGLWMKSQETCPVRPGTGNHLHASSTALLSLHKCVCYWKPHWENTFWALKETVL